MLELKKNVDSLKFFPGSFLIWEFYTLLLNDQYLPSYTALESSTFLCLFLSLFSLSILILFVAWILSILQLKMKFLKIMFIFSIRSLQFCFILQINYDDSSSSTKYLWFLSVNDSRRKSFFCVKFRRMPPLDNVVKYRLSTLPILND